MENQAPFDLNAAIRQWRENLAADAALPPEDGEELEGHLRDSIAALGPKGLSEREAFWVARDRLGGDELLREFGKVNREHIWLNRALWMVLGSLLLSLLTGVANAMATLLAMAPNLLQKAAVALELVSAGVPPVSRAWALGSFLVYPGLLGALILVAWRLMQSSHGWTGRMMAMAHRRPVVACLAAIGLLGLNYAMFGGGMLLMVSSLPRSELAAIMKWRQLLGIFQWLFVPVTLAWILARMKTSTRLAKG